MTRPTKAALVLDGSEVKLRLEAERIHSKTPVHVDWLRFTCLLRNMPRPEMDPAVVYRDRAPGKRNMSSVLMAQRRINEVLELLPDEDRTASAQAFALGTTVAEALGQDFTVNPEIRKGHDFYKHRLSIERNGVECGWIGFLASSDSPRQRAQASTIHCNIYGAATTFAAPGWNHRLADICDEREGTITRVDLALDFFEGFERGMQGVWDDYKAGLCDAGGKRLKTSQLGDWCNGHGRSFYLGSKEAGKQTNVYEKGDQLFGQEVGSPWLRVELRWGNKLRELSTDMLRRPADFFAGASEWHAHKLMEADAIVQPETVACTPRLPVETVNAECTRVSRWLLEVAAPACATAFEFLGDEFLNLVTNKKRPGRLRSFAPQEIARAFDEVWARVSTMHGAGHAEAIA